MAIKSTYLNKQFYNAGIAIALLILLAIGILTYRFLHLTNEYSNSVVHTHHVIEHLQTLQMYLVDAETGGRGFVVTGEEAYLEPYNSALRHIDSQMVELKGLTKDNPSQQKQLDRIHALIKSKLAELALTIRVRQSAGFDSAQAMIKTNIGKATMDSIRAAIAISRNQESNLLSERKHSHQIYIQRLNVVLLFGGIAAVLTLLVIIILLRFENTRRTKVEKELRMYQEHLNDLVKERSGELKASELRWATTLASLADGVIVTDKTGHIVFMNTSAETITGQPVKESLHKQLPEVFNIMSGVYRQPLDELIARVVRERVVTDFADHSILVRKDGKEIPIECNGARILPEDGTLMGVVFVFRDITKQRQADETLRKQAALLNLAHDAIFVLNAEEAITFWSRGAEETYGWTAEEAVGRSTHDLLKTRFPMPLSEIKQEAENTGEWNGELIHTRKDGREIVVASRWAVQWDIWGRHVATLEINRDITERKKAEIAVQNRTEELAAANRELESFSYSVSHDLRNPLQTIGSFTDFLMEDYADRLDEEGKDYLRRIDIGVKKMQSLIDDMLNLSHIGRQEIKKEDVDLSAITRNYLKELVTAEPQRKAERAVQDNVHVEADPRLIHLALENLLRNAWKFTSKKEVTRIEFGTLKNDGQTVYFIKDNGAGFDAKFARKIFEPFKRVHAEKEFGGTGVGLSIVLRVIERHGGKVWAEGEAGKGAIFYFTLG